MLNDEFDLGFRKTENGQIADSVLVSNEDEKPELKYGIDVDLFESVESRVKRNEYFSTILIKRNAERSHIVQLNEACKDKFNLRAVRKGNKYEAFYSKDSTKKLSYLIYHINTIKYAKFDFTDSLLNVKVEEREVKVKKRVASGVIKTSLWNAMVDSNINPLLANELSEIYAWSIDFFALEKNDKFKVVYDEEFIDGKSIGVGRIYAAVYTHKKSDYFAYEFEQDGKLSFYNEKGESLKKAFLKAPLKYTRISSRYTNSRFHPVLKIYRAHKGVDYAAPLGTPVFSIGDGTISAKAYQKNGAGRYVKVKHNSVYETTYCHFHRFAKGIYVGKRVKQGDLIGYVGSTGLSTGPHLDFRVKKNGRLVNPLKIKSPSVKPVKKENMDNFSKVISSLNEELSKIPM